MNMNMNSWHTSYMGTGYRINHIGLIRGVVVAVIVPNKGSAKAGPVSRPLSQKNHI